MIISRCALNLRIKFRHLLFWSGGLCNWEKLVPALFCSVKRVLAMINRRRVVGEVEGVDSGRYRGDALSRRRQRSDAGCSAWCRTVRPDHQSPLTDSLPVRSGIDNTTMQRLTDLYSAFHFWKHFKSYASAAKPKTRRPFRHPYNSRHTADILKQCCLLNC